MDKLEAFLRRMNAIGGIIRRYGWFIAITALLVPLLIFLGVRFAIVGTILLLYIGAALLFAGLFFMGVKHVLGSLSLGLNESIDSSRPPRMVTRAGGKWYLLLIAISVSLLALAYLRSTGSLFNQPRGIRRSSSTAVEVTPDAGATVDTQLTPSWLTVLDQPLALKRRVPSRPNTPHSATPPAVASSAGETGIATPTTLVNVVVAEVHSDLNPNDEYVVVLNLGREINLAGWSLASNTGNTLALPPFVFSANTALRIYTGIQDDIEQSLSCGLGQSMWTDRGETFLMDPDGIMVDRFVYPFFGPGR